MSNQLHKSRKTGESYRLRKLSWKTRNVVLRFSSVYGLEQEKDASGVMRSVAIQWTLTKISNIAVITKYVTRLIVSSQLSKHNSSESTSVESREENRLNR